MMDKKGEIFASKNFEPAKYVNEISSQLVGGSELNIQIAKLQALSDETHSVLKKNVYQHYEQFIETAKDISYLAGETYQIAQTLRDQKILIQNILDAPIIAPRKNQNSPSSPSDSDTKIKNSEQEARKKMLSVLEKVEGAGEIIESQSRTLIFEGDLLEINPDTYSAVQRKRGYLFNDGVMLAVWVTNRRGPQRYKFEAFYELGAIGLVVNIRDPECPKHTFKLLIFPSVHLLQCPNQQDKDAWINNIETIQKVIRNPQKVSSLSKIGLIESPAQETSPSFPSLDSERGRNVENSLDLLSLQAPLPEWVVDIPEDLDVWIAQRNFSESVDLYESFNEFIAGQPMTPSLKELRSKVESRIKHLIETLVSDLEIMTPEKIMQGGTRSIRKSLNLLVKLQRESQATQLFLAHRSAYIKQRIKRLKTDGRNIQYLNSMSELFFYNIIDSIEEYRRLFSSTKSGTAGLVVWINKEVQEFTNSFCNFLFTPQCQLSTISRTVPKLRSESSKLVNFGIDVSSLIDSILLPFIERSIVDAKDKLIEAIRHRYRSQDEVQLSMKFTDEASLNKTLEEMTELGITNLQNYIRDDNSLELSRNTLGFTKSWLHFCQDLSQLYAPEWDVQVQFLICEVLLFELPHLEHVLSKGRRKKDIKLVEMVERDAAFVLDVVCSAANKIIEKARGEKCTQLINIVEESSLQAKKTPPAALASKSSKTTTRFSSPQYI